MGGSRFLNRSSSKHRSPSAALAKVSSGWLESPYGERSSVSILREPASLVVWHGEIGADRGAKRSIIYEGRSVAEATKRANQQMRLLRLRGFRARAAGSVDRDFTVNQVSRTLNVALDQ